MDLASKIMILEQKDISVTKVTVTKVTPMFPFKQVWTKY